MITAIPMNDQTVASHFSKALSVAFFNEQGQEIGREPNPATSTHCQGKKELVRLLTDKHTTRVLVRHIGQNMLERLLKQSLNVFQLNQCRHPIHKLAITPEANLTALTESNQGSPSIHHEKKVTQQSECCGHSKERSDSCCGAEQAEEHSSCCQSKSKRRRNPQAGHSARHGHRGRCCH